jgi:glutathione peroxidase
MKLLSLLLAALALTMASLSAAPLHDVTVKDIDGKPVKLDAYRGQVLLIVNVASECGYTSQYSGLQTLFEKYRARGLTVLGFPCNQFGGQEPGTNVEIKQFCSTKFSVTFPLFDKIDVNGPQRHPLYVLLAGKDSPFPGNVKWNFGKFLVGRDGKVIARYDSGVEPDAAELTRAVETALAAK